MDKGTLTPPIDHFMPHGTCLIWNPEILGLHVASDLLISVAYFSIPFALVRFVHLRPDLVYAPVFYLFSAFILACGLTHAFDIWVLWHPDYLAQGFMKAITAVISMLSATYLWPVMNRAIQLPSLQQIQGINQDLNIEIQKNRDTMTRLSSEVQCRKEAQEKFERLNESLEKAVWDRTRNLEDLTKRLKKSEERLRLAIEASGIGFSDIDLKTNSFLFHSPCSGLNPDDYPSKPSKTPNTWIESIHPDDRAEVIAQIEACVNEKKTYEIEYRIQNDIGEYRWIMARGRPLEYDSDLRPVRLLSTHMDIHNRKLTELHNRTLALIIENSSDLIARTDSSKRVTYMNAAGRRLLGIYPDEDITNTHIPYYHPEWANHIVLTEGIPTALHHGSWQGDTAFLHRDGSEVLVSQLILVHKSPQTAEIEGISTVCRDISDRVKTKQLILQQKETLELVFDGARLGVWDWDLTTNKVEVNQWHRKIFGRSPSSHFTYDDFVNALHPDDRENTLEAVKQALEQGRDYDATYRIAHADQSIRWVSALGRRYCNKQGKPIRMMGIVMDITEKKSLEDEVQRHLIALEASGQRKNEFIALLAHELRNPLAPIKMAAHLLAGGGLSSERQQWCVDSLNRQIQHLSKLVDDLLDVSRISRGLLRIDREVIDLMSVINTAGEISAPEINRYNHTYTVNTPSEPVLVYGDKVRLAQVISNLLNNAAKFTKSPGSIRLAVTQSKKSVYVVVSDNGIGMPRDALEHIFDLFSKPTPTSFNGNDGLGIGLYLSKQIMLLHEGDLDATSDGPGMGSTFRLRLASAHPPLEAQSCDTVQTLKLPQDQLVLIADDNVDAVEGMECFFELRGLRVDKTFDGISAFNLAEKHRPNLIFLDIGMPGMNGYEACQKIRNEPWGKTISIIAVSGWGQPEDISKSLSAGFDHHLVKPVDLEALERLLQQKLTAIQGDID